MEDPFEQLNREDFLQALDPANWREEVQLSTPAFAALLSEGKLLIAKGERQLQLDTGELLALMRFLMNHVALPPVGSPGDVGDFKPRRVDTTEEGEETDGYSNLHEW